MKKRRIKKTSHFLLLTIGMMSHITQQSSKAEYIQNKAENSMEATRDEQSESVENKYIEATPTVETENENVTESEKSEATVTPQSVMKASNKEEPTQGKREATDIKKSKVTLKMSGGNKTYYRSPRKIQIVIEEEDFNIKKAKKKLMIWHNGTKKKKSLRWIIQKDKHIAKFKIVRDGKYKIIFSYDGSSKKNQILKKSFILDQVPPNILITGMSKIMKQSKINPQISITDENMDFKNTVISIINKNTGRKEKLIMKYKKEKIIATCQTLNQKKLSDNKYTIHIVAIDQSKNKNSMKKIFSINRNGSIFSFGEQAKFLKEKFFQRIARDIVLTEKNVNKLKENGKNLLITRDGKNINRISYYCQRRKKNGWNQYEYIIDKKNFTKEGVYRVQVESEDMAKNYNNSALKKSELVFVIDHTKPKIFFYNLEKNLIYNVHCHEVIMKVTDNVKVKSVKVFSNGKKVKVTKRKEAYRFHLMESSKRQNIKISVEDYAGNKAIGVCKGVLVTKNQKHRREEAYRMLGMILVGVLALGILGFLTYHFISAKL